MLVILLPDCTQKSIVNAINSLCDTIGIRTFKKYFPIILTDNGSEFKNPWDIEKMKLVHNTVKFSIVILMFLIKRDVWKRITNTYVMSFQKEEVCISTLKKTLI